MRVAVVDGLGCQQASGAAQGFDHHRHRFPDVLAAEQWKVCGVAAIALHRVEDVLDLQAMGAAGIEVVHAISRRAVDQASAVVGGGVVGQVDRAEPIVACVDLGQRVMELDAAEFLAQRDGHHIAGDAVARQAFFDQRRGQHQQAALGVDECVLERRVQVERLVRGDRPGGGGPDHRERILGQ